MVAKLVKEHGIVPVITLFFTILTAVAGWSLSFIGNRAMDRHDRHEQCIADQDKRLAIQERTEKWQDMRINSNSERIYKIENKKGNL